MDKDIEQDVMLFGKMVDGADRIVDRATKPWKWAVACLVIAVAICIAGWAITTIKLSYRYMDTYDKLTNQIISGEQTKLPTD